MWFKNPADAQAVACAILEVLKLPASSSGMTVYRKKILVCMCRELEKLLNVRRSIAAQREADKLGIGDLRRFGWVDQTKKQAQAEVYFISNSCIP
jgi:hypothetical protein